MSKPIKITIIAFAFVISSLLSMGFGVAYKQYIDESVASAHKPVTAREVFDLVNAERGKAGVPSLRWDDRLANSARFKAADMVELNYFEHHSKTGDDLNGIDVALSSTEHDCSYVSENILDIKGEIDSPNDIVLPWVESEPHYEAMIDAKYSLSGLSIVGNKAVQHFCELAQ